MRILIKKPAAEEYYLGEGQWTSNRNEAKTYPNTVNALNECLREKLAAEVLLAFADPSLDVKIPCGRREF